MKGNSWKIFIALFAIGGFSITPNLYQRNLYAQTVLEHSNSSSNLINSDKQQHLNAINYWSRISTPEAIRALRAELKNSNPDVRRSAAWALRGIGTGAEDSVPDLISILLNDPDQEVRRSAVWALRGIDAHLAIQELIKALDDKSFDVRSSAAEALGSLELEAKSAVPKLIKMLGEDIETEVKQRVAEALIKIDSKNPTVQEALILALKEPSWSLKSTIAAALAGNTETIKNAIPALRDSLQNKNYTLRANAAWALGVSGSNASEAIPNLRNLLEDNNQKVASAAAEALGKIGASDELTIAALSKSLENSASTIRKFSAKSLGMLTTDNPTTLNKLINALEDPDSSVRETTAQAIIMICERLEIQNDKVQNDKKILKLEEIESYLNLTATTIKNSSLNYKQEIINRVENKLQEISHKKYDRELFQYSSNPWIRFPVLIFGLIILYSLFIFGLFWLKPIWILKLNQAFKPFSFPTQKYIDRNISFSWLLLGTPNRNRVLDVWIKKHIKSVRENFDNKFTVKSRSIYIPNPVILDDTCLENLTPKGLKLAFKKCLLIWGEGGIGKTSLACQIARWGMSEDKNESFSEYLMIPVLIEEDLDLATFEGQQPLLSAIRGQLEEMTESISDDFLEQLLRKGRILVIIDHFSEMRAETRKYIHPESPDFQIKSLIITSRIEEQLGHINKTTIQPLRIKGHQISAFLNNYLSLKHKRDRFSDERFFNECKKLLSLSSIDCQGITAMLAKLYADRLIDVQSNIGEEGSQDLPSNTPDLILSYLNTLNHCIQEEKVSDDLLQDDAKAVAWECLKTKYKPMPAMKKDALVALELIRTGHAEERLNYLENRLSLVKTVGIAEDRISFQLNLVAEYLAGLYLVEHDEAWKIFVNQTQIISNQNSEIMNFLLIVNECCQVRNKSNLDISRLIAGNMLNTSSDIKSSEIVV